MNFSSVVCDTPIQKRSHIKLYYPFSMIHIAFRVQYLRVLSEYSVQYFGESSNWDIWNIMQCQHSFNSNRPTKVNRFSSFVFNAYTQTHTHNVYTHLQNIIHFAYIKIAYFAIFECLEFITRRLIHSK